MERIPLTYTANSESAGFFLAPRRQLYLMLSTRERSRKHSGLRLEGIEPFVHMLHQPQTITISLADLLGEENSSHCQDREEEAAELSEDGANIASPDAVGIQVITSPASPIVDDVLVLQTARSPLTPQKKLTMKAITRSGCRAAVRDHRQGDE